jgi:hypothetical protein
MAIWRAGRLVAAAAAMALAAGLCAAWPTAAAAAATVTDCPATEAALSADIASAGAGGTVSFDCASATTIPFAVASGGTGELDLGQGITLDASNSPGAVTFDGGNATGLLQVASGATVTLDGLTLQHGNGLPPAVGTCPTTFEPALDGGAIDNDGNLTIENSTLTANNLATSATCTDNGQQTTVDYLDLGGAIYNDGLLDITGSTLSDNVARGSFGYEGDCYNICAEGGAVMNVAGSATIEDSTLSGNTAAGWGAAVFNSDGGTVVLNSGTFSDNTTIDGDGTVSSEGNSLTTISAATFSGDNTANEVGAMAGTGGAPTTIIDSTKFTANSNEFDAYFAGTLPCPAASGRPSLEVNDSSFTGYSGPAIGACDSSTESTYTISGSSFKDNPGEAIAYGGGTISDSTFAGNGTAHSPGVETLGGAVYATLPLVVNDSKFTGNGGAGVPAGGAIYAADGLAVTGSTFTGNKAAQIIGPGDGELSVIGGGAIDSYGTLTIDTSTLSGNTASSANEGAADNLVGGGAVFNHGTATVTNSTLSDNTEASTEGYDGGGAILDDTGANLAVTNSTIYGNSTVGDPGGTIEQFGNDGSGGNVSVTASTLADNTVNAGAGNGELADLQGLLDNTPPDHWTIGQDIFGSSDGLCDYSFNAEFNPNGFPGPDVTDTGYNLFTGPVSDITPCWSPVSTDLTNTSPDLDPAGLAHNGGPTETVALELGSPAIDAIPVSANLCQATDQRGHPRPSWSGGTACDIGAYEFKDIVTKTTVTSSASPATVGQDVTYTATVTPAGSNPVPGGTVAFSDPSAIPGCGAVALSPAGTASCTVSYSAPGVYHVTAVYSGAPGYRTSSGRLTQDVQYAVALLSTPPLSASPGGSVEVALALEAYTASGLTDISGTSPAVTALCLATATATSCGSSPPVSIKAKFTFNPTLYGALGGGYLYVLNIPASLAAGQYILLFRAAGEPTSTYHAEAGAFITVT